MLKHQPVSNGFSHEIVLSNILSKGDQSTSLIQHVLPHQTRHPRHTLYPCHVSRDVGARVGRAKIHLTTGEQPLASVKLNNALQPLQCRQHERSRDVGARLECPKIHPVTGNHVFTSAEIKTHPHHVRLAVGTKVASDSISKDKNILSITCAETHGQTEVLKFEFRTDRKSLQVLAC